MSLDWKHCINLIGSQLNGKVIDEPLTWGENTKIYRKYILSPKSIIQLKNIESDEYYIRIVLPHCFYIKDDNADRINIIIDENFIVSNIYIG